MTNDSYDMKYDISQIDRSWCVAHDPEANLWTLKALWRFGSHLTTKMSVLLVFKPKVHENALIREVKTKSNQTDLLFQNQNTDKLSLS